MKYISAQPDSKYFIWQLYVQINSFRELGIEKDYIILIGYDPKIGLSKEVVELVNHTKAVMIFFKDERTEKDKAYIPTIRPYLFKLFFKNYGKNFVGENFFYHDSDILFTKKFNWDKLISKQEILVSDTISYIGSKYIKSKGEDMFNKMVDVVGVSAKKVISNEKNSGGAQYIFNKECKNIFTYEFWDKVQKDSLQLYLLMKTYDNGIQSWTADMWSLLWNIWLVDYKVKVHKELDFSWATSKIEDWDKYNIYHNAGVTNDRKDLFYKGKYTQKYPFNDDFSSVSDKFCSYNYMLEIKKTSEKLRL